MNRQANQREHDARRGSAASRGYNSKWRAARDQFLRDNPLCALDLKQGIHRAATVVDHIVAPKLREARESGDPVASAQAFQRFWDRDNWQSLCKHCHDSVKQRLEKSGVIAGCDASGRPSDPSHHWNRGR